MNQNCRVHDRVPQRMFGEFLQNHTHNLHTNGPKIWYSIRLSSKENV